MRYQYLLVLLIVCFMVTPVEASVGSFFVGIWQSIKNFFGWTKGLLFKTKDKRLQPLVGSTEIHDTVDGYRYFVQLRCPIDTSADDITLKSMGRGLMKVEVNKHFYTIAMQEKVHAGRVYIPNVRKEYIGDNEWTLDFVVPNTVTGVRPRAEKARDVDLTQRLQKEIAGADKEPEREITTAQEAPKPRKVKETDYVVLRGGNSPTFDG